MPFFCKERVARLMKDAETSKFSISGTKTTSMSGRSKFSSGESVRFFSAKTITAIKKEETGNKAGQHDSDNDSCASSIFNKIKNESQPVPQSKKKCLIHTSTNTNDRTHDDFLMCERRLKRKRLWDQKPKEVPGDKNHVRDINVKTNLSSVTHVGNILSTRENNAHMSLLPLATTSRLSFEHHPKKSDKVQCIKNDFLDDERRIIFVLRKSKERLDIIREANIDMATSVLRCQLKAISLTVKHSLNRISLAFLIRTAAKLAVVMNR